ncbi:MAG: hypothetical protein ACI9YB_000936 [Halioglobus sp.]|jgi:hypothetical protein
MRDRTESMRNKILWAGGRIQLSQCGVVFSERNVNQFFVAYQMARIQTLLSKFRKHLKNNIDQVKAPCLD